MKLILTRAELIKIITLSYPFVTDFEIADGLKAAVDYPTVPEPIARMFANGFHVEAIKAYRTHTGLGLRESKDALEHNYNRFNSK